MARRITVLGATGSVGRNTLDLVRRAPEDFSVAALVANRDAEGLAELARATGAALAVVADPAAYPVLRERLAGSGVEAAGGREAVLAAAALEADLVMAAVVGIAGLAPTMEAVRRGRLVALANKESLVCAGSLMTAAAQAAGARLLPVDSEHNAIFQVLPPDGRSGVEEVVLTASGGPFRTWSAAAMAAATPEQAVAHPNWRMGAKISVDSATLMNKGLEVIEAAHLFGLGSDRLSILVHPQSVVHGLVRFSDGSVLAQLGTPDMRTPIANCLAWPHRMQAPVERLDLARLAQLTFEAPDPQRFPALRLARAALEAGQAAQIVLNAANEVAVAAFLDRRLGFGRIAELVEACLDRGVPAAPADVADVFAIDAATRALASDLLPRLAA